MSSRIGQGFDAHRFHDRGRLILGGVEIPHENGLAAHSDGDCLLHAIIDALIGAIGAGDLGQHFPDSDPELAGADSRVLLRRIVALARESGWQTVNVDATVIAQYPRLATHIGAMRGNVAADLRLGEDRVNIKASTTEHLGFTGRGEGIAAMAVILVERS